jgi:hypothetical protein
MPAFATVSSSNTRERAAIPPVIEDIDSGAPFTHAQVLKYVDRAGLLASEVVVSIRNIFDKDETGAITLDPDTYFAITKMKMDSRVRLKYDGETIANLYLTNRKDTGSQNQILLTFKDCRVKLAKHPVRGALVRDPYTGQVIWSPRHIPRANPNGGENCTRASIDGFPGECFVYTPSCDMNTGGTNPDDTKDDPKLYPPGVSIPWTPYRKMCYWHAYSLFNPGAAYPNFIKLDTDEIDWFTPSSGSGEMNRKMADTSFHGTYLLQAIYKTLDIAGEVGLYIFHTSEKSFIAFHSRVPSEDADADVTLNLQRVGNVSDLKTIYDFVAEVDSEETVTGIVVDGDTAKIESEFYWNLNSDTSTLIPAWTDAEFTLFKTVIKGNGTYAQAPKTPDDAQVYSGKWDLYDGTGGLPKIFAKSKQALQLARSIYQKVYRAFKIPGDTSTAGGAAVAGKLSGVANKFGAIDALSVNRAIDDVQLQPFFDTDADQKNNRGKLRVPTLVKTKKAGGEWSVAPYNNGLRSEADGLIYLDGLTDDLAGDDNIYTGSLGLDPDNVVLKEIKINAYIQHDARINGFTDLFWNSGQGDSSTNPFPDPNNIKDMINPNASNQAKRKGMQHYVFAPEAFREEHQVNSRPQGETAVSRVLHTDQSQIQANAVRRLRDKARFKKMMWFALPGIRTEFRAGMMMGKIDFKGTGQGGSYKIGQSMKEVAYDFENDNKTVIVPEY